MRTNLELPFRTAVATLAVGMLFSVAAGGDETKMQHAKGTFDVKVAPVPLSGPAEDNKLGRMSLEKTFHGPLDGRGLGQMLTGECEVEGSGVYVAIERVTGTLDGRKGSFLLHHRGVMTRGVPSLSVEVVPDSGSEELVGITGTFHITIEGGQHLYDLEYSLPVAP